MIKITRTITLDGQTQEEYVMIIKHLEDTRALEHGWELKKDALLKRVVAIRTEETDSV
jgi:hypothetical protein